MSASELEEMEDNKRALFDFVDDFINGIYDKFNLRFGNVPMLYEDEYRRLVGDYTSSTSTVKGKDFVDEYIYDIGPFFCEYLENGARKCKFMRKRLILRYRKDVDEFETPVYAILSASGKTEDFDEVETVW